jgi:hypothetical protein
VPNLVDGVPHSEIGSLGHPRAALLGFAVSQLPLNVYAPQSDERLLRGSDRSRLRRWKTRTGCCRSL